MHYSPPMIDEGVSACVVRRSVGRLVGVPIPPGWIDVTWPAMFATTLSNNIWAKGKI